MQWQIGETAKQKRKNLEPIWHDFLYYVGTFLTIFGILEASEEESKNEFENKDVFAAFLSILDTLLGAMLDQNEVLNLCKVTFSTFLTLPKND